MKLLKFKISFCFFLIYGISASQSNDSIIYLKEVVISNSVRPKEIKINYNGTRDESMGFYENQKIVSLISNIPDGKLTSVELFFDVKLYDTSKNLELGLLIYEINSEGQPGTSLLPENVRFKVQGNKREKITLDLSELNLVTKQNLFIGFETINLNKGVFVAKLSENRKAISYYKNLNDNWFVPVRKKPVQLRLNISVLPN